MRKTINRGEDGGVAYELAFEPGAREASLTCSALTPRLAEDLIADLQIFVDQAKTKRRTRAVRGEHSEGIGLTGALAKQDAPP